MRIWDGRYRVERTLGEGGMGQVLLSRDLLQNERLVAVKLLLPEYREATSDFMREYSVQRRLDHPAIPRVFDFGFAHHQDREVPYFVMDYVRGIPLANAVLTQRDPKLAWPWILQVLRGLDHLHRQGYLHRDLKPSNVLVNWDADVESSAHLIDFGIAIPFHETPEQLFIGTPEYSAPELMAGAPFDVRQDLYSIGLLLYEVISGRRPWSGEDPTELYNKRMYSGYPPLSHPACPPALARLVDQLLRPSPDGRPKSAAEVIERFCEATGLPAQIETPLAFRRRLEAQPFPMGPRIERAALAWLGHASPVGAVQPTILVIDDPPGYDGASYLHELTDRAAVGGARILRFALEPRPHGPLEALEPAFAQLRRLREGRGAGALSGLAGAATLLTRLQGPTVLAIQGLEWADTLSLEVLSTVFTGARNPGLRVVATTNPVGRPVAERAFERLLALPVTLRLERERLSVEEVTDWVDECVGHRLVPDQRLLALWEAADGRPAHVREIFGDDLRRGALQRTTTGYAWNEQADVGPIAPHPHPGPITAPHLPVVRPSQSLEDLLATIHEPVPESVVSTFMGLSSADVRRLVADGYLARMHGDGTDHHVVTGPRAPKRIHQLSIPESTRAALHERLARAIELAPHFDGKAERAAQEWLRSTDPLRAVPHLLQAALGALASAPPRRGDKAPRAAALLDDARKILEHEERARPSARVKDRLRGLRRDLAHARLRLARQLGEWPAWQAAATELFERGLESGHVPSMEMALDALVQLAADRGAWAEVERHAKALVDLKPELGEFITAWVAVRLDIAEGRLAAGLKRVRAMAGLTLPPERLIVVRGLEAEVRVAMQHLAEAEAAIVAYQDLAQRLTDRGRSAHAALLRAMLARESQQPELALTLARQLATALGDEQVYRIDGRVALELARGHLEFGWIDTAREHAEAAKNLARRDGDAETVVAARLVQARIAALSGDEALARRRLDEAAEATNEVSRVTLRELATLEIALATRAQEEPERLVEAARRLANAADQEGLRGLVVRALALAARAATAAGLGAEALASAEMALERSTAWGVVGLPRHQLLFVLARARFTRREGFRARRLLGQARSQLRSSARRLSDPAQRAAFLEEPYNALIEAGDLTAKGPISRRAVRFAE
ncbi:MAG: serine/threonine protein kinase [Deltaproteobacteria bacterium]|nr:serine/threonine protein kinase [Deltaproteobacteria bacterium]